MTEPHRDPSDLRVVSRLQEREDCARRLMTRELERRFLEAQAKIKRHNRFLLLAKILAIAILTCLVVLIIARSK